MAVNYLIKKIILRHIIPFRFNNSFEEIVELIDTKKENGKQVWRRDIVGKKDPERDIYDYVKNEFRFDDETGFPSDKKFGCKWLYSMCFVKKLKYFPEGIFCKAALVDPILEEPTETEDDTEREENRWAYSNAWDVQVKNPGLSIFRNGIGFLWYELVLPIYEKGFSLDYEKFMSFQNRVRELNRSRDIWLWEEITSEPENGIFSRTKRWKEKQTNIENSQDYYLKPFLFSEWIHSILSFLEVDYFAGRKSAYSSMIKNMEKSLLKDAGSAGLSKSQKDEIKRKIKTKKIENEASLLVPDKPILFTYAALNSGLVDTELERESTIYHLANGYTNSYHYSKYISGDMKKPFGNVIWYATQEGGNMLLCTGGVLMACFLR